MSTKTPSPSLNPAPKAKSASSVLSPITWDDWKTHSDASAKRIRSRPWRSPTKLAPGKGSSLQVAYSMIAFKSRERLGRGRLQLGAWQRPTCRLDPFALRCLARKSSASSLCSPVPGRCRRAITSVSYSIMSESLSSGRGSGLQVAFSCECIQISTAPWRASARPRGFAAANLRA